MYILIWFGLTQSFDLQKITTMGEVGFEPTTSSLTTGALTFNRRLNATLTDSN